MFSSYVPTTLSGTEKKLNKIFVEFNNHHQNKSMMSTYFMQRTAPSLVGCGAVPSDSYNWVGNQNVLKWKSIQLHHQYMVSAGKHSLDKCWGFKECPPSRRPGTGYRSLKWKDHCGLRSQKKKWFEITGSRNLVSSRWTLMAHCFNLRLLMEVRSVE